MRGSYRLRQAYKALRRYVDTFEARWGYLLAGQSHGDELPQINGSAPQIALVKQDVYQDLYCCPPGSSARDVVFSSLKRTGPVALLTKLNADFWIVETEDDPECNVWKEKWFDCHQQPIEFYESLKTKPFLDGARGHRCAQGEYSVAVDDVNWGRYDIVISLDISVPGRLTRRYPRTVWCYYISEPCMSSYRKSQKKPIRGYDLFLNQRFRNLRVLPGLAPHEVEFPYFLQYYGCFDDLLSRSPESRKRHGIFLESHTAKELTDSQLRSLEAFGPVAIAAGTTEEIACGLMKSKYFIRFGGRIVWGQAMVEAIAAGDLAIGNPREYKHRSLFTPATTASTFDELLNRLSLFESNQSLYRRELARQRRLLDYLCFTRPLRELFRKARSILNNRAVA